MVITSSNHTKNQWIDNNKNSSTQRTQMPSLLSQPYFNCSNNMLTSSVTRSIIYSKSQASDEANERQQSSNVCGATKSAACSRTRRRRRASRAGAVAGGAIGRGTTLRSGLECRKRFVSRGIGSENHSFLAVTVTG